MWFVSGPWLEHRVSFGHRSSNAHEQPYKDVSSVQPTQQVHSRHFLSPSRRLASAHQVQSVHYAPNHQVPTAKPVQSTHQLSTDICSPCIYHLQTHSQVPVASHVPLVHPAPPVHQISTGHIIPQHQPHCGSLDTQLSIDETSFFKDSGCIPIDYHGYSSTAHAHQVSEEAGVGSKYALQCCRIGAFDVCEQFSTGCDFDSSDKSWSCDETSCQQHLRHDIHSVNMNNGSGIENTTTASQSLTPDETLRGSVGDNKTSKPEPTYRWMTLKRGSRQQGDVCPHKHVCLHASTYVYLFRTVGPSAFHVQRTFILGYMCACASQVLRHV